ncbi:cutinase family protein [Gordonia humi]|uniref:cutinase family protein n=1 Tax=Gordonia humi TaxID=686429 RepID=UPI00360793FB
MRGRSPPDGDVGGDDSVARGEHALDTAARAFRAECPGSHITVVGHSQGALVAGNVRDDWSDDPLMRDDVDVVLVSDPRAADGAMSQLPSVIPGFTHTGPRPASPIPTSSVCHDNDAICNVGNPIHDPGHAVDAAIGYVIGAHEYQYVPHDPGRHDLPPVNHIVPSTPLDNDPPNLRDTLEPVTQALIPDAPIIIGRYEPTPIRDYIPQAAHHLVPDDIGDIVLPPLPPLGWHCDDD